MSQLKTGCLPRDHSRAFVKLTPHLRTLAAPLGINWYDRVASWGMMLNDRLGCCTCSMCGHLVLQQTTYNGRPVLVTDDDVLHEYEFAGYRPGIPSTDAGWTVQAALDYLVKYGMSGVRVYAYGEVDHTNRNALKQAIFEFGAVAAGVNLPQSAMDQFNAGQPWTIVAGSAIDGGHCILLVGYDADYLYAVTWGGIAKIAWSWWDAYCTETWAVITEEWDAVTGLSLEVFGQEWADTFGGSNPFARPLPAPPPLPPLPRPAPDPWWRRAIDWLLDLIGA